MLIRSFMSLESNQAYGRKCLATSFALKRFISRTNNYFGDFFLEILVEQNQRLQRWQIYVPPVSRTALIIRGQKP